MRKALLLMTLFVSTMLMAGPVTLEQAQQKAADFIASKISSKRSQALHHTPLLTTQQTEQSPLYVFNVGDNDGYVVVSGDDRTEEILGYGTKGHLDNWLMPDNMRAFLQEYADAIRLLDKRGITAPAHRASRRISDKAAIAPLLKSTWNQGQPYNAACPVIDGTLSVTGCVATAMAQVMYYHKWPSAATTVEIPSYTSNGNLGEKQLDALPAGMVFDWSSMKDNYQWGWGSTAGEMAVAQLMRACGQSVQMQYGTESGAAVASVAYALVTYFDYEETTTKYLSRNNYSYNDWQEIIYKELEAGRPVLYGGQSSGGGHAFVCDGYSEDDFFHINWGWGGNSDNYFRLRLLDPSNQGIGGSSNNSGYGCGQEAIIGIQKNDGSFTPAIVMSTDKLELAGDVYEFSRANSTQNFTGLNVVYSTFNYTGDKHNFDLGVGLMDADKNIVQGVMNEAASGGSYPPGYGWVVGNSNPLTIEIGSNVPDGDYRLILISRETGSSVWKANENSDIRFIPVTIAGNKMTTTWRKPVINLQLNNTQVEGNKKARNKQTITMTLTNKGTLFRDDVMLVDNNDMDNYSFVGFIELEAGATDKLVFDYTPKTSGTHHLSLYGFTSYIELLSYDINISGSAEPVFTTVGVANYDNNQNAIVGSTYDVTLKLTNKGEDNYNGTVEVALVNMDEVSYASGWMPWGNVNVAPGASVEKNFVFENLPSGNYAAYIKYELDGDTKAMWGATYALQSSMPDLKFSTTEVKNYNSERGGIDGTMLDFTIKVDNTGGAPYSGTIQARLAYEVSSNSWSFVSGQSTVNWQIDNLAAGTSTTKQFVFSNLDKGTTYALYMTYTLNGESKYAWSDDFKLLSDDKEAKMVFDGLTYSQTMTQNEDGVYCTEGNTYGATIYVKNTGEADYDGYMYAQLQGYFVEDGGWYSITDPIYYKLTAAVGESTSASFSFDNPEFPASEVSKYRVAIGWMNQNTPTQWGTMYAFCFPPLETLLVCRDFEQPTLNEEDFTVAGNVYTLNMTIQNEGTKAYNDKIITRIWKHKKDNSGWIYEDAEAVDVSIELGAQFDYHFDFNNPKDDNYDLYSFEVYYLRDGELKPLFYGAEFKFTLLKGDANGDGVVDVADVVAIVNKILEKPSENFNEEAADINGDGVIDVSDVVSVVNIILKGGTQSSPEAQARARAYLRTHGFILGGEE